MIDCNKYRKIDGRTKKRIEYLIDRTCMQCGEYRLKALRIMPKCYIHDVECLNCIKFRTTKNQKGIRMPMLQSNSMITRIRKYKISCRSSGEAWKCQYCPEGRWHSMRYMKYNGKSTYRLKCYNCYECKPRSYDKWVDENYPTYSEL
jgi:hypothetical protein